MTEQGSSGGGGCAKALGIGCLGLVALLIVGSVLLWIKGPELLQWAGGKSIELFSTAVLEDSGLPAEEARAISEPLVELAERVKGGEVEVQRFDQLVRFLFHEPPYAFSLAILRGFEHRYARRQDWYDEAARSDNALAVNRFMRGLRDGAIDQASYGAVMQTLSVEQSEADGHKQVHIQLDKQLSREQVEEVVQRMRTAADQAGVDEGYRELDLPMLIRQAIDRGISAAAASDQGAGAASDGTPEAAPDPATSAP